MDAQVRAPHGPVRAARRRGGQDGRRGRRLPISADGNDRIGVIVASGVGGLQTFEDQVAVLLERGPTRVSPLFIPMMIANMGAAQLSMALGLRGPLSCPVTACASGNHAHRRRARGHSPRSRGRDAGGRRRGGDHADLDRRVQLDEGPVDAQRRSARRPAAPSTPVGTGSSWARPARCWCWRSWATRTARGADIWCEVVGLRHERRRPPPDRAGPHGPRAGHGDADGDGRRRHRARAGRLHQRPRHLDAGRRPVRDPCHPEGAWARTSRPRSWSARPSRCTATAWARRAGSRRRSAAMAIRDGDDPADDQPARPRSRRVPASTTWRTSPREATSTWCSPTASVSAATTPRSPCAASTGDGTRASRRLARRALPPGRPLLRSGHAARRPWTWIGDERIAIGSHPDPGVPAGARGPRGRHPRRQLPRPAADGVQRRPGHGAGDLRRRSTWPTPRCGITAARSRRRHGPRRREFAAEALDDPNAKVLIHCQRGRRRSRPGRLRDPAPARPRSRDGRAADPDPPNARRTWCPPTGRAWRSGFAAGHAARVMSPRETGVDAGPRE